MGLESLLKAWVSRALPQAWPDNDSGTVRAARYGELYVIPTVRKQHALADEGSYFVATNLGTGVATAAAPTAFSDTAPLFSIQNNDVPSNLNNKRIHMDWMRITQTAAGTAGVDLRFKVVLDTTVPSGGTTLTTVNPNMDAPRANSVAVARLLPVGVAQSGNSRILVGSHQVIPAMTAPLAVLSEVFLNFGGVEVGQLMFNGAASANAVRSTQSYPPITLGPGQCFMLEFLITSQSAASSWTVECGWWER